MTPSPLCLRRECSDKMDIAVALQAVLLDQPTYSTGVVASSNLEVLSIKKKDALRLLADRDLKVKRFPTYLHHHPEPMHTLHP